MTPELQAAEQRLARAEANFDDALNATEHTGQPVPPAVVAEMEAARFEVEKLKFFASKAGLNHQDTETRS